MNVNAPILVKHVPTIAKGIATKMHAWLTTRDARIAALEQRLAGAEPRPVRELGTYVDGRLAGLEARLVALEARPAVHYDGIYVDGRTYTEGALTTRQGGLWLCERQTATVPGTRESGWRLIVKSGAA